MLKRILITGVLLAAAQVADAQAPPAVRAQAREIFATIIAMDTSEGRGQVPAMAEYLAGKLRAAGFPAEDVHILRVGDTAALVVRYRGTGKGGRPILFLAHMDVVPAKREDWERDPFKLIEENGFFFARGAYDIKSEVAILTATFVRLKAEHFVPARDVVLVFSGDEESNMETSRALTTQFRALLGDPEFALNSDGGEGILDEGTGAAVLYHVQGAESSYATFDLTVRNPGGHSSYPRPDNAIYELADALKKLQSYQFPVMWNDWTIGSLKATASVTPGPLGAAITRFVANPNDAEAAAVLAKEPTLVARTRTTCVATMLRGGHADNALPQSATATVNCRIFPGTSVDDVQRTLQGLVGEKVEIQTVGIPLEARPSPMRKDVMDAVAKAVHASYPGVKLVPDQAPYSSEAAIYSAAGIPTYGVTSSFIKDSDLFEHGLNERIPVASFYAGLNHWYVMIKALAAPR